VLKAAIDDIMSFANNRITLVEGKREDQQLYDSMPEAISQAIALSEVTESVQFVDIDKTLIQCLLQNERSSILPIRWAKLDIFAIDKG
jgi:hypothetical protein